MLRATLRGRFARALRRRSVGERLRQCVMASIQFMPCILRMSSSGFKLLGRGGTPVSQAHQGLEPGEPKRTELIQKAQRTFAPRRTLAAKSHFHNPEPEVDGIAAFVVKLQRGK